MRGVYLYTVVTRIYRLRFYGEGYRIPIQVIVYRLNCIFIELIAHISKISSVGINHEIWFKMFPVTDVQESYALSWKEQT